MTPAASQRMMKMPLPTEVGQTIVFCGLSPLVNARAKLTDDKKRSSVPSVPPIHREGGVALPTSIFEEGSALCIRAQLGDACMHSKVGHASACQPAGRPAMS